MKKWILFIAVFALVLGAGIPMYRAHAGESKKQVNAKSRDVLETPFANWQEALVFVDEIIEQSRKRGIEAWEDIPVYAFDDILRDEESLITLTRDKGESRYRNNSNSRLSSLLTKFDTKAIRVKDDGTAYFAYDTDNGYRLYIYSVEDAGRYYKSTGYILAVGDKHDHSSFKSIKAGDPIEKVEEIDSAASLYKDFLLNFWDYKPEDIKDRAISDRHPLVSVHYLTDGLMFIRYDVSDDNKIVVYDTAYYEDYVMPDCWGRPVNYRILDCHLPWRSFVIVL